MCKNNQDAQIESSGNDGSSGLKLLCDKVRKVPTLSMGRALSFEWSKFSDNDIVKLARSMCTCEE